LRPCIGLKFAQVLTCERAGMVDGAQWVDRTWMGSETTDRRQTGGVTARVGRMTGMEARILVG
jgi:hypothetical protein